MTTPLFLLRCVQLGISIRDLDLLTVGLVNDMYIESDNDSETYRERYVGKDGISRWSGVKRVKTKYFRWEELRLFISLPEAGL